jgi:hypothetical protein
LKAWPGFALEVAANGAAPGGRREHLMFIIANARVFGGGFKVAPTADLEDGRLNAIGFLNMGLRRRLALMGKLMKGTHVAEPEVMMSTAPSYRLVFDHPPAYETDGEANQAASREILVESVPRALKAPPPPNEPGRPARGVAGVPSRRTASAGLPPSPTGPRLARRARRRLRLQPTARSRRPHSAHDLFVVEAYAPFYRALHSAGSSTGARWS